MAFYKVLEDSFIGHSLVQAGAVVDFNDDPASGGMSPGKNLAACDADGNLLAAEGAKAPKPRAAKAKPVEQSAADTTGEGEALA